ncbi:MAG: hypothetical protein AAGF12_05040 [Myxococcota bacterium]
MNAVRTCLALGLMGLALESSLWAAALGPLPLALGSVLFGMGIATLLLGEFHPGALGAGAAGALAHALVSPFSFVIGGGLFVLICFLPRVLRSKSAWIAGGQAATAWVGGVAGTYLVVAYSQHPPAFHWVAVAVGALLAVSPLLFPVDDRIAYRLRILAGASNGTLGARLRRALVVRRQGRGVMATLARPTQRRVHRSWWALIRAAETRVYDRPLRSDALDRRIAAYVHSLQRATRAATTASELSQDLDDVVLAELRLLGDDLNAKAEALVEVTSPAKDPVVEDAGKIAEAPAAGSPG